MIDSRLPGWMSACSDASMRSFETRSPKRRWEPMTMPSVDVMSRPRLMRLCAAV
ncbi:MAG: hypothetical protein ACKOTE_14240 [Opitutaceae bacterium]